jgi:hypothetical protein
MSNGRVWAPKAALASKNTRKKSFKLINVINTAKWELKIFLSSSSFGFRVSCSLNLEILRRKNSRGDESEHERLGLFVLALMNRSVIEWQNRLQCRVFRLIIEICIAMSCAIKLCPEADWNFRFLIATSSWAQKIKFRQGNFASFLDCAPNPSDRYSIGRRLSRNSINEESGKGKWGGRKSILTRVASTASILHAALFVTVTAFEVSLPVQSRLPIHVFHNFINLITLKIWGFSRSFSALYPGCLTIFFMFSHNNSKLSFGLLSTSASRY